MLHFREGNPTADPNEALPSGGGCGLPLGGLEETSGYKVGSLGVICRLSLRGLKETSGYKV